MNIVSKEVEIQDRISTVYENLISEQKSIYEALSQNKGYNRMKTDLHVFATFHSDPEWESIETVGEESFVEHDIYCYLVDIIEDYRDIGGDFPEYLDMIAHLEQVMLKFALQENYEVSAIIKRWLQKFIDAL